MVMDFLAPAYYYLEKQVASKQIPNVSTILNRWSLSDWDESHLSCDSSDSFDHSLWSSVLQRHVSDNHTYDGVTGVNGVDYDGIAQDPEFDIYLKQLQDANPDELSRPEQLAFWMNAYNALCIFKIVQHEKQSKTRLESINQLTNDDDGPVWDQEAGIVGGVPVSLNTIEHEKLRGTWNEPRIHACIVCASASCPNLRREAFVAPKVNEQMDDQMRDWMSNPTKGLKLDGNYLWLSRIFLWFGNDFGNDYAGVSFYPYFGNVSGEKSFRAWLAKHVHEKDRSTKIEYSNQGFRYFDYNWNINRAAKSE